MCPVKRPAVPRGDHWMMRWGNKKAAQLLRAPAKHDNHRGIEINSIAARV
jgi:hypothetical protein